MGDAQVGREVTWDLVREADRLSNRAVNRARVRELVRPRVWVRLARVSTQGKTAANRPAIAAGTSEANWAGNAELITLGNAALIAALVTARVRASDRAGIRAGGRTRGEPGGHKSEVKMQKAECRMADGGKIAVAVSRGPAAVMR